MRTLAVSFVAVLLLAGCAVQMPGQQSDPAPRITADPAAVREYLDQVRPILENTAADVARVANVNVQVDGGNVSVNVDPASIEQARQETRQGLDELKAIQPPAGLQETHQRLVTAYEEALPAFDNFSQAVQSGDPVQIANSARKDLPKIQRLLNEINTVRQQLQQAAGQ